MSQRCHPNNWNFDEPMEPEAMLRKPLEPAFSKIGQCAMEIDGYYLGERLRKFAPMGERLANAEAILRKYFDPIAKALKSSQEEGKL